MSIRLPVYVIGLHPFYGKGSHSLLWSGLWPACGKITINGMCNFLNCCEIFIMYTHITNVAMGYIIQPGGLHAACGLQVGDPWSVWNMVTLTRYCNEI